MNSQMKKVRIKMMKIPKIMIIKNNQLFKAFKKINILK